MTADRVPSDIDAWLAASEHPLISIAVQLREAILGVSPEIVESIKWNSPNYALADDFATLNLSRPTVVRVVLHTGAKAKPEHPQIVVDDPLKLLKWAAHNRAVVTFASEADAAAAMPAFVEIVRGWVAQLPA